MSQTTTSVGRLGLADPDIGFDTLDGGTALHAQLRGNVTKLSNHLMWRFLSTTLANSAAATVTHNFGLAVGKLKWLVFEGGVQRTAAQVAADYTVAQTSVNEITVTNISGGSKTLLFCVFAGRLGITASDLDPAVDVDTTGNVRAAELRTTGNDIVVNHDAAGAGADWTTTLRRPSSGMSSSAIITLPSVTGTLPTLAGAETLANKTLTSVVSIGLNGNITAPGSFSVGSGMGAATLTLGEAASIVYVAGRLISETFECNGDDLILNQDAAGSGADWKATIRRPASGMSAAAVYTLPVSTTTLLSTNLAQVVTLKDIDGGTASNTSRITVPKASKATLDALTRKSGTVWYSTDLAKLFVDNGTTLTPVGGGSGGGGGSAAWSPAEGGAPLESQLRGEKIYSFTKNDAGIEKLVLALRVPTGYVAGTQVNMTIDMYVDSTTTGNTIKLKATTYHIRKATDAIDSTANAYASTNASLNPSATAKLIREATLDLTNASGQINSNAIAAGDLLFVELTRESGDTETADLCFVPSATEVSFS